MKAKHLLLALTAVAPLAHAQSSVQIFGIIDAGLGHYSTGGTSVNRLENNGVSPTFLAFKGIEDLGGGMGAYFYLDGGFSPKSGIGRNTNTNNQDNGNTPVGGFTFNRRATVSLGGDFGEVRLGRDYSPDFVNKSVYAPFGTVGVAGSTVLSNSASAAGTNISNSIHYFYGYSANVNTLLNNPKGFYAHAAYGFGENPSGTAKSSDGNYMGLRLGYGKGPMDVSASYASTKSAAIDNHTVQNIGGSYDFGVVKAVSIFNINKSGNNSINNKSTLVGVTIPVGQHSIPISYSRYTSSGTASNGQSASLFGLGYRYRLSKMTQLYATYGRVSNSGGAAFTVGTGGNAPAGVANTGSNGYEFGIVKLF
jgi:predicted porin